MTSTVKRNVTVMETYSGKYVDLLNPEPDQICLADLAVHLSNICRFGGAVSRFYSVAEHSVRVADALPDHLKIYGLLHDAHEAYTNDLTAPMKRALVVSIDDGYDPVKFMQRDLDWAIREHFGLAAPGVYDLERLKEADDALLFAEAAGLKYSHGIGEHWGNDEYHEPLVAYGWTPAEAERRFIETYERLTNA